MRLCEHDEQDVSTSAVRLLLDFPVVVFLVCFVPVWFFLHKARLAERVLLTVGAIGGILSIVIFLSLHIVNLFRPGFIWHDEATILAITSAFLHGGTIYHANAEPAFYALLYGPSTFLVYAPFLWHTAHPVTATRIASGLVSLVNTFLFYRILRIYLSPLLALALTPIATATMLAVSAVLLGTRGDPWLFYCLSVAVCAAFLRRTVIAAIVAGIACGLAVDFKITVVPVVCLVAVILHREHKQNRVRASLVFGFTTATTALAPFTLPGISLLSYGMRLSLVSRQHLLADQGVSNLIFASFFTVGFLLVALLGSEARAYSGRRAYLIVLYFLALSACIVSGSKAGAGEWHLWPMLPFALLLTAQEVSLRLPPSTLRSKSSLLLSRDNRTLIVVTAISLAATIVSMRYGLRALSAMQVETFASRGERQRIAEAEIRSALKSFPKQNVSMGFGSVLAEAGSSLRFELPLADQNYFFDPNAVIEGLKERVEVPPSVVNRVNSCSDVWLIPHNEVPFSTSLKDLLPVTHSQYLFPDTVRLGFPDSHSLSKPGLVYDIWVCKSML